LYDTIDIETETKTGNEWTLTLNKLTFISYAVSFIHISICG